MKLNCGKKLTRKLRRVASNSREQWPALKQRILQQKSDKGLMEGLSSRNRNQTLRNIVSFLLQEAVATWEHKVLDFSVPDPLGDTRKKELKGKFVLQA